MGHGARTGPIVGRVMLFKFRDVRGSMNHYIGKLPSTRRPLYYRKCDQWKV